MNNNSINLQNILYEKDGLEKFLTTMIKNMMESLLSAELTSFLNYEKYDPSGKNSGNSRNGYYRRNYTTRYGNIKSLKIPRDRNCNFEQKLIKPYSRRQDCLEDVIIKMYSKGMSTRDIAEIIEKLYGPSYSPTTVSNITDIAMKEVQKWHNRPLKNKYSILFIDGLSIKLRRDTVENESVYFILGIDEEGYREIIDFYIGGSESSAVWEEILTSIKLRGVSQVLLGVMDGLSGLEEAFLRVYPKADIQRCIVHKVRNSVSKIRKKDYLAFTQDLKKVYKSPCIELALKELENFKANWGKSYPKVVESWVDNTDNLFTFYKYPTDIQLYIYTTNWIERSNKEIRKRLKTKDSMPTENSVDKLIYLSVSAYNEKWSQRKLRGFASAKDELLTMFEKRYPRD